MAASRYQTESRLAAVADSPLLSLAASALAAAFIGGATVIIGVLAQDAVGMVAGLAFQAVLGGLLAGVLVWFLFSVARSRRQRLVVHVSQVADLNHHIRNALQIIRYQAALSKDGEQAIQTIDDAVVRIEHALETIFPMVAENPSSARKRNL